MAQRRMLSLSVIDTDKFLDMPMSARLLYYELSMRADDDGFVSAPKKIVKLTGCAEDDLKTLITKNYLICFDSGVVVITHWKMHNYIPKDRYKKSIYQDEFQKIQLVDNTYCMVDSSTVYTECIQPVYKMDTQDRLGKDNIYIVEKNSTVAPLVITEIVDYLNEKTGFRYRATSKSTQNRIKARLAEGYTPEDFKTVIDSKAKEWGSDAQMRQYLRPDTLFSTKFESYLNNAECSTCDDDVFKGYLRL